MDIISLLTFCGLFFGAVGVHFEAPLAMLILPVVSIVGGTLGLLHLMQWVSRDAQSCRRPLPCSADLRRVARPTTPGPRPAAASPGPNRSLSPRRLEQELRHRQADLLTCGISARAMADDLGVPLGQVVATFEDQCRRDLLLRIAERGNDCLLYRGATPIVDENEANSWLHLWPHQSRDDQPDLETLCQWRVYLEQQRDRLFDDLQALEDRQRALYEQQAAGPSETLRECAREKRHQLRREMDRVRTAARLLNRQLDTLSEHIHTRQRQRRQSDFAAILPSATGVNT